MLELQVHGAPERASRRSDLRFLLSVSSNSFSFPLLPFSNKRAVVDSGTNPQGGGGSGKDGRGALIGRLLGFKG
jgi:hypothetical protein